MAVPSRSSADSENPSMSCEPVNLKLRACAECRRLKYKCDRRVPCGNCVKKSAGDICPDGTLLTGEGHRRFWGRFQGSRAKATLMSQRIGQLEDALRISHALTSQEKHPLLVESLLGIKDLTQSLGDDTNVSTQPTAVLTGNQSANSAIVSSHPPSESDGDSLVPALGNLFMSPGGRSQYSGPAAWIHTLPQTENPMGQTQWRVVETLPQEISLAAATASHSLLQEFSAADFEQNLATLRCFLPSYEAARRLKDIYYSNCEHCHHHLPMDQCDEVLSSVYNYSWDSTQPQDHHRTLHQHAVVFVFLATASLFDPQLPPRSIEASRYYELACAALAGTRVNTDPTLEAVQALCLLLACPWASVTQLDSMEVAKWSSMGTLVKVVQLMGLHRDPTHFNFPPQEAERRRRLFWGVYRLDIYLSGRVGLPPGFTPDRFDTRLPTPDPLSAHDILSEWGYTITRDCLERTSCDLFARTHVKYSKILEREQALRSHPKPVLLQHGAPIPTEFQADTVFLLRRRVLWVIREESIVMHLHRHHLKLALSESADSGGPYEPSVITSLQCAIKVLDVASTSYEVLGILVERLPEFTHLVSEAALSTYTIITRCRRNPRIDVEAAVAQLEAASEAAQKWLRPGGVAGCLLDTLLVLSARARAECAEP